MSDGRWYNNVKVVGAYLGESAEKKTPFFALEFETESNDSFEWKAWLTKTKMEKSGKTVQMVNLETLYKCGFVGKNLTDMADETMGIADLFHQVEKPINILVKGEEYEKDGQTKTYYKVEAVTVSEGRSKFDKAQAAAKFGSMGIDGDLALIRQQLGVVSKPAASSFTDDEIPF